MNLILLILLTLILILFLAIIVILYIGFLVSIKFKVESSETTAELNINWLNFTLYHMDLPKDESEEEKEKKSDKKDGDVDEDEEKTLSEKLEKFFYDLKCRINPLVPFIKDALNPVLEFIINGSKAFKLTVFYLKFIIGFEESSATALTVGYIWAFASILNIAPMVDISAIPDFENEVMNLYSDIEIEIYPLKAIKATIRLLTRKAVIRLIFEIIKVIV